MTDIIIYTTGDKLLHKQDKLKDDPDKSNCGEYYLEFSRFPKKIKEGDRIYFAVNKNIVGYFLIQYLSLYGEPYARVPMDSISWNSKTWKDIKPIPTKPFQGFKYADKVEGLK